ncbi:hypothetical protein [Streptomyces sp. HPF1205]|uniref:hypothetical protein n=1 Tax=Streptomyces sp. HPF1205 TaxID=2873262 RepID=UPI001CED2213|nr:hypothetical protein [Streptomyces sp. HPF1205]
MNDYHPDRTSETFHAEDAPEMSERFRTAMLMAQTPEQQAIAREIYRRLEGGAEVEDIKHLLEEELRIVTAQRGQRVVSRTIGSHTSFSPAAMVGFSRSSNMQGTSAVNGLGARSAEEHHG